jgi:TonB family protein
MLGTWMVYALLVTTLIGLAGWIAEKALVGLGRPGRWAWAFAVIASAFVPITMLWIASRPEALTMMPGLAPVELPALAAAQFAEVDSGEIGFGITWALMGVWIATTTVLMAGLLIGWRRLQATLGGCSTERVSGVQVLVSEDLGPAVTVGLRRQIVLPRWLLNEPVERVEAVVIHERSHLRSRDPELILLAAIPALLMPWNLPLWWQLARLRLAVEVDCDRRVLARTKLTHVDYGRLLLDVGSRGQGRRFAAAFSERTTDLQRRLERIMETPQRKSGWRVLGLGFLAGVLTSSVFLVPRPEGMAFPFSGFFSDQGEEVLEMIVLPPRERIDEAPLPPVDESLVPETPTFTPMTVRPEITNVAEVVRAMEFAYPKLLRDGGIGGRVVVWFFIDREGRVRTNSIAQSSGHAALDQAALKVASVYRFTPALNRDQKVAVWVQFPITFEVREQRIETPAQTRPSGEPLDRSAPTFTTLEGDRVTRGDAAVSPYDTAPTLQNAAEVAALLNDEYPPLLRGAGVGGRVVVGVFVDTEGRVQDLRIAETSGHAPLDQAALRVARAYRFTPALKGGDPVALWMAIPLTFEPQ